MGLPDYTTSSVSDRRCALTLRSFIAVTALDIVLLVGSPTMAQQCSGWNVRRDRILP